MKLPLALVLLIAVTRLIEMNISRRHRGQLLGQGAAPTLDPGFTTMVLVHIGILIGSLLEPIALGRSAPVWVASPAAVLVLGAFALRVWAIASLGQHWNVRVVNSTSLGLVQGGPYRYIRHPNYVAVFLELALLPVVAGAWLTAIGGTALHLVVLRRRIQFEENVLSSSTEYQIKMSNKPRFLPRFPRRSDPVRPTRHA